MIEPVVALVLAAGDSKRFGSDKRFYGSPPLLERVLRVVTGSFEQVVLVHKEGDDLSMIDPDYLKALCVSNFKSHDLSLGASIALGVRTINHAYWDATACAIFLADMPFIKGDVLRQILELHHSSMNNIIIPTFNGRRGHPVIFPRGLFAELSSLSNTEGAKSVISKYKHLVKEVPVNDVGITVDIDTKSVYDSYFKQCKNV